VLRLAKAGEELVYRYEIPRDHAPGTYWYHPHHHGSTAIQLMGGMGLSRRAIARRLLDIFALPIGAVRVAVADGSV
jgi:hypothetical protein